MAGPPYVFSFRLKHELNGQAAFGFSPSRGDATQMLALDNSLLATLDVRRAAGCRFGREAAPPPCRSEADCGVRPGVAALWLAYPRGDPMCPLGQCDEFESGSPTADGERPRTPSTNCGWTDTEER